MIVDKLFLYQFRNLKNQDIKFSNRLNLIYGNNGEGKTNLLEAIYLLSITKSFRQSNREDFISFQEREASVFADIKDNVSLKNIGISFFRDQGKKLFINHNEEKSLSNFIKNLICICFTPNEEIGIGVEHLNYELFNPDFAYTVDGSDLGEFSYENFNASAAEIEIHGVSVHPGSAKNTMINAVNVGIELNGMLPSCEKPEHTEGYEGFYYLESFSGNTDYAKMSYILRDHDHSKLEAKKATLLLAEKLINEKYGEGTVKITISDQYKNMAEHVKPCIHLIDNAIAAMKTLNVTPIIEPIRGGTDGATLSYMGLPCPNLGTGGFAYHGEYEHITVEGMDICTDIIVEILKNYAK